MSTVRVTYPITAKVHQVLGDYPEIAKSISIPDSGRSELEIVCLLNNTHYESSKKLLKLINTWLPLSGPIGKAILKTKNSFQRNQRVAELLLFTHLHERYGDHLEAPESSNAPVCPDLIVGTSVGEIRMELYTPVDFVGLQLLEEYLKAILGYLDLPCGFKLSIHAGPKREADDYERNDLFYAYTFPSAEKELHAWLIEFQAKAEAWLSEGRPSSDLVVDGPGGKTEIRVACEEYNEDSEEREITIHWGTRSTDTQLFFQVGSAEECARSEWGNKIRTKLRRRQCGGETEGLLRLLVVNFSMADTGWPHFISEPWFTKRFDEIIRAIVGDGMTYDAVIPAQIYSKPCFGMPVVINPRRKAMAEAFIKEAGMDKQCEPPPEQTSEEIAKELENML